MNLATSKWPPILIIKCNWFLCKISEESRNARTQRPLQIEAIPLIIERMLPSTKLKTVLTLTATEKKRATATNLLCVGMLIEMRI